MPLPQLWERRHQNRSKPMNLGRKIVLKAYGLDVYKGKKKSMRGAVRALMDKRNFLTEGKLLEVREWRSQCRMLLNLR